MRSLRVSIALALMAGLGFGVSQGVAQEDTTLRVDVDIVNLLFSVRDKKSGLIGNLEKEDFTILEEGQEQTIKFFTRETDLPLTIGLLVDVSRSQENLIEVEKEAATQFFSKVLRPKDMAFLISFGSEAELLQDYTNSAQQLRAGLDDLRVIAQPSGGILRPGPVPTANKPKGTLLYDAIYLASTEKLRQEVGRKAIVVITDGVDMGSHYSRSDAIEAAHRSNAIIYSIYYSDPRYWGGSDGDLKRMSEDTGGRVFRVNKKNSLDDIFTQIQEEMRSQYSIGYTPTNPEKDGSFREVEVRVNRKDAKVQARKGYYATPNP
ncbi:MAG: VWA domain-containing protein [Bryobacteraceae bacterium]